MNTTSPTTTVNPYRKNRDQRLKTALRAAQRKVPDARTVIVEGMLKRVTGLTMEAVGCQEPIGARCHVMNSEGNSIQAEVVGFSGDRVFLMPFGPLRGIVPNARVVPTQRGPTIPTGAGLLGRVVDSEGNPLDSLGRLNCDHRLQSQAPINPLEREPIRAPLDVGVRSINALLSVGRGQRLGLFAGTGVGNRH